MHLKFKGLPGHSGRQVIKFAFVLLVNLCTGLNIWAQDDAGKLKQEISSAKTDLQKLDAYKKIIHYFQATNIDSALSYAQQGLQLFSSDKYETGKANMLNIQAVIYDDQGLFDISRQKTEDALKIFTSQNDKAGIARSQNQLGVEDGRKGNYTQAIQRFITALAIFESIHDTAGIVSSYIKLGAANDFSRNYSKSLEYYNKALLLARNSSTNNSVIFLNNNIGTAYCRLNDFEKAKIYLQKALDLSTEPKYAHARIEPLTNMGNIYKEEGDDAKALSYFREALSIAGSEKQSEEYIRALLSIDNVIAKTDPGKALASLEEALNTTKETGQKNMQADVLEAMIGAATIKQDYKQAFAFLLEQHEVLDSIYDLNKAKEIANLQAVYELNKSNEQIAALRISEQKNKRKKDIIIVIALFLGCSVITMLYLYRNSRILNFQLSKRKDELKNANDVKDKLFSIIGHDLNSAILNMPVLLELYRADNTTEDEKTLIIDSLEETSLASGEILENLLNWGKSQIKGISLNQTYFDASDIIRNKIHLMRILIRNKNITVANHTPADTKVYADVNHFIFVIRNLLSNAIKYTPTNGTIEIDADVNATPGFVVFSVKDNGIGINSELQKNIFAPFNVSAPGTANEAGNSIGLLLCKEFVVANGGKIWVESEEGKGSTFYFSLKLRPQ